MVGMLFFNSWLMAWKSPYPRHDPALDLELLGSTLAIYSPAVPTPPPA